MRTVALSLVPLISFLAAGCGGESLPPCEGECGSLTIKVALTDTNGAAVSCSAAGVARIGLVLDLDEAAVITREIDCEPGTITLSPLTLGVYRVHARALDGADTVLAENARLGQLIKKDDARDVEVSLVPGPPSKLGTPCSSPSDCAEGYDCVKASFGSTETMFCTASCGTGPSGSPPANGDLACQRGWSGPGIPSCILSASGSGDVDWSCAVGCSSGMQCPTGMTCVSGGVCIN